MSDRPTDDGFGSDEVVGYPVDGTLDLHMFRPSDAKSLVSEYLDTCIEKGLSQIRIVHGKGQGTLRTIVHSILETHPGVDAFRHEGGSGGSWGATVVDLKRQESGHRDDD